MDYVFNQCVDFLMWLAPLLGLTYNEINVWIFCVIWPLITLALIGIVVYLWLRLRAANEKGELTQEEFLSSLMLRA